MSLDSATAPGIAPHSARPGFDHDFAEALLSVAIVGPNATGHPAIAPFDGAPLVDVPFSTVADVDMAFDTAREAQRRWAETTVAERKRAILRFHDLVLTHREQGLDLIQWETGKIRMDAMKELLGICTAARHYARDAERLLAPQRHRGLFPGLTKVRVVHKPMGVIGLITPWNYPAYLPGADAIPALLAGNAVVLKPDHQTSLSALWVVDLMHQAGIPQRVMQVVLGLGPELGPEIVERADFVMFTGSSAVGSRIAGRCGERLVGCSMELGGKNAMIVAADADPARSAEIAIRACFDNAGQLCVGIERLYVVDGVYDAFMERFLSRIAALRTAAEVGWGADYGSLISATQLARVSAVVDDAVAKGATVLTGGRPLPEVGPFYYAPTVLTGVTEGMTAYRDETFGPVVAVQRVSSVEEAIGLANDSEYGLNASVLIGDTRAGMAIAEQIHTGSVNVNEAYEATFGSTRAPMGGVRKSGIGRRNGDHGLLKYTEEQTIAVQRAIGMGVPPGLEAKGWSEALTRGFQAVKAIGLK